ncbi:MAG: maleylpyruvate isomerase family mycothiol-dependent enzyme [Ilumatobacter sp.]|nr:maleylpyruvate isomerase family mycothiol-dependent enzyme [Ilumatobacter sp.]
MNPDSARVRARDRHVHAIRSDTDLVSAVVRTASPDAPIPACPGWDVRRLVTHLGAVHRWATSALVHGRPPDSDAAAGPPADDELAVWIVDGAAALIDAVQAADPEADTWHPFPLEQRAWVWGRRQAIETAVHRWDAQHAVGDPSPIDAQLAGEGIHEYVEMGLPRVLQREQVGAPSTSLHVHCTDVDGEWLLWGDGGDYRMLPIHDKGDAALRGPAADLLLVLMGRLDRSVLDIVGDPAAAAAWLDLPGW